MLERIFRLRDHKTTVRTELVAGLTTYLTMAYILFVNPAILSDAGMDHGAVFVATCAAAAVGSLMMGLFSNYPLALAPGMGLNAYFTYDVVLGMGVSWQTALGAVFISGALFLLIACLPVRSWLVSSIPASLKVAIAVGIGLFLALIALKNAGIVVDHPAKLVTLGDLSALPALLAIAGFFLIVALDRLQVPGAIVISILLVTFIATLTGVSENHGVFDLPPDPSPTFAQMDLVGAFELGLVTIIFAFLFVDLFDTMGTLVGVARKAGLLDEEGELKQIRPALIADSIATMTGALFGTSTTTSYIESSAGVRAGGRTGLVAVTVAVLFIASLFLAPLALTVPACATAPALLFVACIMISSIYYLEWDDATEYVPAVIAAITMPLTFSIATGIGFGFICWTVLKLVSGQWRSISIPMAVLSALFVVRFALFAE